MNTYLPILNSMPLEPAAAVPEAGTPIDTAAASTYTDVNALEGLKRNPNSPAALAALASQVEALFLQMMLKSMRDASTEDSPDSNEMGMYQDMFDKQIALSISQHHGVGLGDLLKRQLAGRAGAVAPAQPKAGPAQGALPGTAAIAATPAQFVARILPTIRRTAAALGVHPLGLLAQAALETGWGQRIPRTADGAPSLNLFGVKVGPEWSGARATANTVEFDGGVASQRRTAFRAYGSIEEGVSDFARLLKTSPRYREALAAGGDPQAYVDRIGRSGYATDPEYGNKLTQILNGDTLRSALGARTAAL